MSVIQVEALPNKECIFFFNGWLGKLQLPPSLFTWYTTTSLATSMRSCVLYYTLLSCTTGRDWCWKKRNDVVARPLYFVSRRFAFFTLFSFKNFMVENGQFSIHLFFFSNGPVQLNEFVKFTHTRNSTISDAARVLLPSHQTKYILPIFYCVAASSCLVQNIVSRMFVELCHHPFFRMITITSLLLMTIWEKKLTPGPWSAKQQNSFVSPHLVPFHIFFIYPSRALHLYFKLVQPKLCFLSLFSSFSSFSFDICLWERTMCVSQESFQ